MPPPSELLTTKEIAKRLRVSPDTVKRWVNDGWIPAIRPIPNRLMFEWEAVLEAVKTKGRSPRSRAK